ncbi:hypothetical protein [Flavobacterium sp.]|uniref:hypothetical protein n=1 Tax=Flavobacteriaceae TaxID=49546 RepID=UPI004048BCBC
MKTKLLLITIFFALSIQSWGQEIDFSNTQKMGLIAYLTQVKYEAEFKMSSLINNSEYEKQKVKASEMNANYNMLKLSIDKLINQMSADLYNRNFLRLYRKTDKFIKTGKSLPKKFAQYETALKEIETLRQVLFLKSYSSAMAGPTYAELFSGGTLLMNSINSYRDFRRKKIEAITGILVTLKLEDISKLKLSK